MPKGIKVIIDYSDIIEELNLTAKQASAMHKFVSSRMAKNYANTLRKIARTRLKNFRAEYVSSVKSEGDSVFLTNDLAYKIEEGSNPYDIKQSNFSNKKKKKGGGWYVDIPFRHSSPRSSGRGSGFSTSIPTEVYNALKNKIKEGGEARLNQKDLPSGFDSPITRTGVGAYGDYTHKDPIYEGLVRTGNPFQRKYYTFRRISDKSDPNSWIHPGFKPMNLMDQALSEYDADSDADDFINQFLNSLR